MFAKNEMQFTLNYYSGKIAENLNCEYVNPLSRQ